MSNINENWTKEAAEELREIQKVKCHSECQQVDFCSIKHHARCLNDKLHREWVSKWLIPEGIPLFKDKKNE
jgi:hypothetical protein